MLIWARLSTWNTPTESALQSMSYTAGSSWGSALMGSAGGAPGPVGKSREAQRCGCLATTQASARRMALSMPSARMSTFSRRSTSRSSLSH